MSYRDSDTGFLPLGERERPPTKLEWAIAGFAMLVAVVMILSAIAGDSAPPWLKKLHMWPIGIVELAVGCSLLIRARARRPDESYSPRTLRLLALFLILLGAASIAVAANLF